MSGGIPGKRGKRREKEWKKSAGFAEKSWGRGTVLKKGLWGKKGRVLWGPTQKDPLPDHLRFRACGKEVFPKKSGKRYLNEGKEKVSAQTD